MKVILKPGVSGLKNSGIEIYIMTPSLCLEMYILLFLFKMNISAIPCVIRYVLNIFIWLLALCHVSYYLIIIISTALCHVSYYLIVIISTLYVLTIGTLPCILLLNCNYKYFICFNYWHFAMCN